MDKEKISYAKKVLEVLEESLTKKQFEELARVLTKLVVQTTKQLAEKQDKSLQSLQKLGSDLKGTQSEALEKMRKEIKDAIRIKDGKTPVKGVDYFDGKDGENANAEEVILEVLSLIPSLEEELPKFGEPIRDSLELLADGEKLSIDAIQDLREELNKLKKMKSVALGGGGNSGTGGHTVKMYDLSASLNGVLTTFAMPAFWRIISVHLHSYPYSALRENVHWTQDASAMTISFTSEIDAATQLEAGGTLLVQYSE